MKPVDILIVGVGGQGTVLASKILAQVGLDMDVTVKVSEIHGMSQRGGSVVTQVRFGQEVHSPIIQKGHANVILAFEKLEALRWMSYLAADGQMIVNDQELDPMPVIIGAAEYPEGIIDKLQDALNNVTVVNALQLAEKAGNIKAVNVVLLGVLAKELDVPEKVWLKAIEKTVPPKFVEVNKRAFQLGFREAV
ncbi:MAG: indolepyruvate oxidoreductase subunit beta [Thermoanaerobacteraceae bacterium]|nr:indolepyruvate oxidoreductase subunit beta [Thermoanaerobacteraceae bacterium]